MKISGRLLSARESSVKGKTGEMLAYVFLDIYDSTARLVQCELRKDGNPIPSEGSAVACDVTRLKPARFGGGVVAVISNLTAIPAVTDAPPSRK